MDHFLDIHKIRLDVLGMLHANGHDDEQIAAMTAESVLNEFCCHHGFRGNWGMALASVLDSLRATDSMDTIHPRIQRDLRKAGHSQADILQMTVMQAFTAFCRYNGFSGDWGTVLAGVLDDLRAAAPATRARR